MTEESVTRVILARHGEASYRSETDDPGGTLTELGRSQAYALAVRSDGEQVAAIYCSTLSREYEPGAEPSDPGQLARVLIGWFNGSLSGTVLGGESGHHVAGRMFTVLTEIVRRHASQTVLVVSHGGAILATLGSIAPGRTGLPGGATGQLREEDMPGGASFVIEHTPHGWRLCSDRPEQ